MHFQSVPIFGDDYDSFPPLLSLRFFLPCQKVFFSALSNIIIFIEIVLFRIINNVSSKKKKKKTLHFEKRNIISRVLYFFEREAKSFSLTISIKKAQESMKAAIGVPIRTIQRIKQNLEFSPDGSFQLQGKFSVALQKRMQYWTTLIYASFGILSMNFV